MPTTYRFESYNLPLKMVESFILCRVFYGLGFPLIWKLCFIDAFTLLQGECS